MIEGFSAYYSTLPEIIAGIFCYKMNKQALNVALAVHYTRRTILIIFDLSIHHKIKLKIARGISFLMMLNVE